MCRRMEKTLLLCGGRIRSFAGASITSFVNPIERERENDDYGRGNNSTTVSSSSALLTPRSSRSPIRSKQWRNNAKLQVVTAQRAGGGRSSQLPWPCPWLAAAVMWRPTTTTSHSI